MHMFHHNDYTSIVITTWEHLMSDCLDYLAMCDCEIKIDLFTPTSHISLTMH